MDAKSFRRLLRQQSTPAEKVLWQQKETAAYTNSNSGDSTPSTNTP
jgi:hypothetical protein